MQANTSAVTIDVSLAKSALAAAVRATQAAGEVIAADAPRAAGLEWVSKGTADFVTDVDRTAETRIAEVIAGSFPDALILGEENSPDLASSDSLTFVVDPLDGTTNFLHGYPQYSVSVAAMLEGEIIAGAVLNVARGDFFTAFATGGSFLNDAPIRVSDEALPARSLIGTGFPFKNPELLDRYAKQFVELNRRTAGIRRAGSAALDLADVACGRFDGFWELILAPWDVAAGILIVREAGGIVTDMNGTDSRPSHSPVVAGNPAIHQWLLATLRAADES